MTYYDRHPFRWVTITHTEERKMKLRKLAASAVIASFLFAATPAFTQDAYAKVSQKEQAQASEDDSISALRFTKVKTTVTLTDSRGLFELFAAPLSEWELTLKFRITVSNDNDVPVTLTGGLGELDGAFFDGDTTGITVPAGGKATLTMTVTKPAGSLLKKSLKEQQVLSLLNGKSVKASAVDVHARFSAEIMINMDNMICLSKPIFHQLVNIKN